MAPSEAAPSEAPETGRTGAEPKKKIKAKISKKLKQKMKKAKKTPEQIAMENEKKKKIAKELHEKSMSIASEFDEIMVELMNTRDHKNEDFYTDYNEKEYEMCQNLVDPDVPQLSQT